MSKKRFCSVFLPWCVFALLLGHEVWHIGARYIMREGTRALAVPTTGLEHEELKVLDPFGALKVSADEMHYEDHIMVAAFNHHVLSVSISQESGRSVMAALYRNVLHKPVELIFYGKRRTGEKDEYMGVYPVAGQDQGMQLLDDDLDGKFEVKIKLSNGLLTPEEIAKRRPVREEAGEGGGQ